MHPKCIFCGKDTQVAHHFIKKSESSRLRYEIENLINLCNFCHARLHHNESYWSAIIVAGLGVPWFERLKKMKHEYVKTDVHFYIGNAEKLRGIFESLEGPVDRLISS
jgi:hypothetical protein